LDAVQRLVDQREDEDECETTSTDEEKEVFEDTESHSLRLLGVKNSSAAYAVAAPEYESAIQTIRDTGKAISAPENAEWSGATLSSIKELSEVAKSLRCEIEFRLPGVNRQYGDVLAKITPSTFQNVSASAFIHGDTSVYGKIERVGGATASHCGIRLPERPRKMLIFQVANDELVRQLGQFMYQYVVVSGKATWFRHNWTIKTMVIESFEPPKKGSIFETFKRVYAAGGNVWDEIDDPNAAIAEMRGD
jgi:hypothetical protein